MFHVTQINAWIISIKVRKPLTSCSQSFPYSSDLGYSPEILEPLRWPRFVLVLHFRKSTIERMKMKSAGRGAASGMKIGVGTAKEPAGSSVQRARPTNTPPRGRLSSTEKMRVTVYKCAPDAPLQANEQGKALIVPDTWQEFLNVMSARKRNLLLTCLAQAVSRKFNVNRIISVETLDGGTILEELDEIMAGDKLVIRYAEDGELDTSNAPDGSSDFS